MTKQEKFVAFINNTNIMDKDGIDPEILDFWIDLKSTLRATSISLTNNGMKILTTMKLDSNAIWSAADIAKTSDMTPRSVSSSIRKLVTDELVEKQSSEPVTYKLTTKGKEIII